MKRILTFALVLLTGLGASSLFAQSSLVATLSHEGTITTYYGAKALREAHDAATNGDVITLSEGAFSAVDITKAITIRGVGMFNDDVNGTGMTIIEGGFTIWLSDYKVGKLSFEGIYNDGYVTIKGYAENLAFIKCRFKTIATYYDKAALLDATFIHCHITGGIEGRQGYNNTKTVSFINCVVSQPSPTGSYFEMQNCILSNTASGGRELWRLGNSILRNCVIIGYNADDDYLATTSIAYNCVYIGSKDVFAKGNNGATNKVVSDYGTIFKTYNGSYKDGESFELTDEAKSMYLGQDGTEVGINGGNLPFDATMNNPRITKCKVASKSTADGKLSVEIEVKAAE